MPEALSSEQLLNRLAPLPAHCRLDDSQAGADQLGIMAVSGPDAGKFLQGQLTCDVLTLADGETSFGASCTPQGRMRALFRLVRHGEQFLLLMPRAVVPSLLESLKKYAVFFKAQLRDASSEYQLWGVLAAESIAGSADALVVALPGAISRQLLLLPAAAAAPALPGQAAAAAQWFAAEVLLGEPAVYPETVEKLLPHHANLPGVGGVSFSKGCYTGQEIVARMEYRGKIKTHLQPARLASTEPVLAGSNVLSDGKAVGEVVRSARLGQHQLLLITLSDPAINASLQLDRPDAPILELFH